MLEGTVSVLGLVLVLSILVPDPTGVLPLVVFVAGIGVVLHARLANARRVVGQAAILTLGVGLLGVIAIGVLAALDVRVPSTGTVFAGAYVGVLLGSYAWFGVCQPRDDQRE